MKKIKLLFIFTLFFALGISAQNSNTGEGIKTYKITFPTVDAEHLKPLVPVCNEIFQSNLTNMESEPFAFYYTTSIVVTEEMVSDKFAENNFDYSFELNIVKNENE